MPLPGHRPRQEIHRCSIFIKHVQINFDTIVSENRSKETRSDWSLSDINVRSYQASPQTMIYSAVLIAAIKANPAIGMTDYQPNLTAPEYFLLIHRAILLWNKTMTINQKGQGLWDVKIFWLFYLLQSPGIQHVRKILIPHHCLVLLILKFPSWSRLFFSGNPETAPAEFEMLRNCCNGTALYYKDVVQPNRKAMRGWVWSEVNILLHLRIIPASHHNLTQIIVITPW